MTIAATSMRIELNGIGPNALNNDADRDDDVWMPNDPTMFHAGRRHHTATRRTRRPKLRSNTLPCHGHFHTTSASPMTVFGEDSRRGVDFVWRDQRKAAGSSRNGIRWKKAGCRTITIRNCTLYTAFGQTRFTALEQQTCAYRGR